MTGKIVRLSVNQRKVLRWIAHTQVWPALLDQVGYGNRRRVVHSLSNAGLVELDGSNTIRLTEAGRRIHAENCRRHAEETGFPFVFVL